MKNKNNIVSYEIAELLRDCGFDSDVYFRIYPDGSLATSGFLSNWNDDNIGCCSAPTYSEAIDWILDCYEIFIEIDYLRISFNNYGKKYKYFVIDVEDDDSSDGNILLKSDEAFATRNEAIEAALKDLLTKLRPIALQTKNKSVEEHKTLMIDGVEIKPNKEKVEIILD